MKAPIPLVIYKRAPVCNHRFSIIMLGVATYSEGLCFSLELELDGSGAWRKKN